MILVCLSSGKIIAIFTQIYGVFLFCLLDEYLILFRTSNFPNNSSESFAPDTDYSMPYQTTKLDEDAFVRALQWSLYERME